MTKRIADVIIGTTNYRVSVCEDTPREAVYTAGLGKLLGTHIASAPEVLMLARTNMFHSPAISEEFYGNLRGTLKAYVTHGFPLLRRGRFSSLQSSALDLAQECISDGVEILSPEQYRSLRASEFMTGNEPKQLMVEFDLDLVRMASRDALANVVRGNTYVQARLGIFDTTNQFLESWANELNRGRDDRLKTPLEQAAFEALAMGPVYLNSFVSSKALIESTMDAKVTVLALDDYVTTPSNMESAILRTATRTFSDLKRVWQHSIDVLAQAWNSSWTATQQTPAEGRPYRTVQPEQPRPIQTAVEKQVKIDAFLDTFVESLSKARCILCSEPLASHPDECLFLEDRQSRLLHGECYQENREGPRALQGQILAVTYRQLSAAARVLQKSPVRKYSPQKFFDQLRNLDTLLSNFNLKREYEREIKK